MTSSWRFAWPHPTKMTRQQKELIKQLSETMVTANEPHSRGLFEKMKDIFG